MATRCPHCGASNPDDLPFCNSCGEPVDADLRLVMDMKKSAQSPRAERVKRRDNEDDEVVLSREDEEKKFPVAIVVLAAVVVVAVVLFFVLR